MTPQRGTDDQYCANERNRHTSQRNGEQHRSDGGVHGRTLAVLAVNDLYVPAHPARSGICAGALAGPGWRSSVGCFRPRLAIPFQPGVPRIALCAPAFANGRVVVGAATTQSTQDSRSVGSWWRASSQRW
jgi:hypothetical protein